MELFFFLLFFFPSAFSASSGDSSATRPTFSCSALLNVAGRSEAQEGEVVRGKSEEESRRSKRLQN